MRTTVNLPPALHERVRQMADDQGLSLSNAIAQLTARGLAQVDSPVTLDIHHSSGLPTISIGRAITSEDVAAALEEE